MEDESSVAILKEIRDLQHKFVGEYRCVANESLAIQRQSFEIQQNAIALQKIAVEAQAGQIRLYRKVLVVTAVVVVVVVAAIWFLLRHV